MGVHIQQFFFFFFPIVADKSDTVDTFKICKIHQSGGQPLIPTLLFKVLHAVIYEFCACKGTVNLLAVCCVYLSLKLTLDVQFEKRMILQFLKQHFPVGERETEQRERVKQTERNSRGQLIVRETHKSSINLFRVKSLATDNQHKQNITIKTKHAYRLHTKPCYLQHTLSGRT